MQKTGPQRVPPCRSLHLQLKLELALAIKNNLSGSSCIFFPSSLVFLNCGWMVFNCDCMLFKNKKQSKPLPNQKLYLVQKSCFLYENPFQKLQKTGPQRVPPCRSLHLQLKIGINTCNKHQTFWLSCIFFPSSLVFLIVAEWFLIVIF